MLRPSKDTDKIFTKKIRPINIYILCNKNIISYAQKNPSLLGMFSHKSYTCFPY